MILRRMCSMLATACGLAVLSFSACSEDDPAAPPNACKGRVVGTPRSYSSPTVSNHTHHTFSICESARGQIVRFGLGGAAHVHTVDLVPDEVNQILDGMTIVSGSGAADGHAHTIDYTR